jgi:hypothetical protein
MRSFLIVAVAVSATVAACGGKQATAQGDQAAAGDAPPPVVVPASCDEPAAAAKAARADDSTDDKVAAVFALAECEQLRLGVLPLVKDSRDRFQAKVGEIAGLYAEVIDAKVPKFVIGGHVRTGDLYGYAVASARKLGVGDSAGDWKAKAKESYESGLDAADATDKEARQDLDIADWVKSGCKALRELSDQDVRFKVCHPWKDSWR